MTASEGRLRRRLNALLYIGGVRVLSGVAPHGLEGGLLLAKLLYRCLHTTVRIDLHAVYLTIEVSEGPIGLVYRLLQPSRHAQHVFYARIEQHRG